MNRQSSSSSSEQLLECPGCGKRRPAFDRFCLRCGLPLAAVEPPGDIDPTVARARKVDPSCTAGPLVRCVCGLNQIEAEMLSAILLEAGVPSVITRTAGFDVPEFLAAGPRDVLVAQSGLEVARAVLHRSGLDRPTEATSPATPRRVAGLAAAIFTAVGITALVAWILTATPH